MAGGVLGVVHLLLGVSGFTHDSLLHLYPKAVRFRVEAPAHVPASNPGKVAAHMAQGCVVYAA